MIYFSITYNQQTTWHLLSCKKSVFFKRSKPRCNKIKRKYSFLNYLFGIIFNPGDTSPHSNHFKTWWLSSLIVCSKAVFKK